MAQPLSLGVLGTAAIARDFAAGVRDSTSVSIVAVASRSLEKAQAFAASYGIPKALGSYEALLADPQVDAIYIPLPNSMHAEWALRAIAAGKHVLCEKPLATSPAQAREMFQAAKQRGVYLVEAYPYLAQPQTRKLRELLRERVIGDLQLIQAHFGFTVGSLSAIRLDPALGGGALMDAGCYPVSLVRIIAGERPTRVHAVARWGDTNVDRSLVATLEFSSGLLAQVSCSFDTAMHRRASIAGTDGILETTYWNNTSAERAPTVLLKRGTTWTAGFATITAEIANGLCAEAEDFARLVSLGWPSWPGATEAESIDIALMLDAITRSARSNSTVELTG
jgi:D-xylose 1-dehydrogenase (NADP+, D-xylono-1,5-lactone-forming)